MPPTTTVPSRCCRTFDGPGETSSVSLRTVKGEGVSVFGKVQGEGGGGRERTLKKRIGARR